MLSEARIIVHEDIRTKELCDSFGIVFEDIKHADEVGLHTELVHKLLLNHRGDWFLQTETVDLSKLYVTASCEESSGDTIIRCVNLTEGQEMVNIELGCRDYKPYEPIRVLVYEMTGFVLGEENGVNESDEFIPHEAEITTQRDALLYTFKPYSLTILRIQHNQK